MDIASRVGICLEAFVRLEETLQDDALYHQVVKEHGRFKIWTGTFSAQQTSGSLSLEYHLRDSQNLRERVMSLLLDLYEELRRYGEVDGCPEDSAEDSDSDDEDDDDDSPELEHGQLIVACAINDPLRDIREIVDLLYRFASTLRCPAGDSRIRDAFTTLLSKLRPDDVWYVGNKFPAAEPWLLERLLRTLSASHESIRYRQVPRDITAGDYDEEDGTTARNTSLSEQPKGSHATSKTFLAGTRRKYSQAAHTTLLRLPQILLRDRTFRCEICSSVLSFDGMESWRAHLFEDIPPYVCLQKTCKTANKLFSHREDWEQHVLKSHCQVWTCPLGCEAAFDTSEFLSDHIFSAHNSEQDPDKLQGLLESCARPNELRVDLKCPLCEVSARSQQMWFEHVGHHLEEIAFFALPAKLFVNDGEEFAVEEEQGWPYRPMRANKRGLPLVKDRVYHRDLDDSLDELSFSQESAVSELPQSGFASGEHSPDGMNHFTAELERMQGDFPDLGLHSFNAPSLREREQQELESRRRSEDVSFDVSHLSHGIVDAGKAQMPTHDRPQAVPKEREEQKKDRKSKNIFRRMTTRSSVEVERVRAKWSYACEYCTLRFVYANSLSDHIQELHGIVEYVPQDKWKSYLRFPPLQSFKSMLPNMQLRSKEAEDVKGSEDYILVTRDYEDYRKIYLQGVDSSFVLSHAIESAFGIQMGLSDGTIALTPMNGGRKGTPGKPLEGSELMTAIKKARGEGEILHFFLGPKAGARKDLDPIAWMPGWVDIR